MLLRRLTTDGQCAPGGGPNKKSRVVAAAHRPWLWLDSREIKSAMAGGYMAAAKKVGEKRGPGAVGAGQISSNYQMVPVSRLHLDLKNYRHDHVGSEAEAIAKLCDSELVAELARDIAERGAISPMDVIGVMEQPGNPGHFVSLEGNRRTCALIVLSDPNRAPPKKRNQLREIAAKAVVPEAVMTYRFDSRDQAKQWIDLRHLGQQGGAGVLNWTPEQKNRAVEGNTKTTARADTLSIAVLDRLVARSMITPEQKSQVKVSTLTRYLGTPGVRALLGLKDVRELIYTHAADEVDAALRELVVDSISPQDDGAFAVHSRSKSSERIDWANGLRDRGLLPSTKLSAPSEPAKPTRLQAGGTVSRSARHPSARDRLFMSNFIVAINDPVLLHLRKEALDLSVRKFTFSANYLLRAFIEQTMTLFLKKRGKWAMKMNDQLLTQRCAEELAAIGVQGRAVTVPRKAAGDADAAYSLHSLGHAVHGGSIPTDDNVKKHFDTWRPALEAMLEFLAKPRRDKS